jgi:DNA-binding GntR family transcriptional regulator
MTQSEPGMAVLERTDSLGYRAYRALRQQIAVGGLAPGERVTERGLAARLGVSATPVREALRRLEQERLIERSGARAVTIAAHPEDTIRELMYAETVIRAAAARFATAKITAETLDEMQALVDTLERDLATADPETQLTLARRFDDLLLAAAGNDIVAGLVDSVSLFGWQIRLRAIQAMHTDDPAVGHNRIRAHRDILAALRARDAVRVETLMRTHLTTALDYLFAHAADEATDD